MTFERWENGVTEWDEEHLNQLIDAWSNTFGIVGPNPTRLGKLNIPEATSAPGSPITSQIYVESDEGSEGSGGRLKIRHAKNGAGAATWVPYLPYRQYLEAAQTHDVVYTPTTSFSDVTGLTITFTPTGGRLFIFLLPDSVVDTGSWSRVVVQTNSVASPSTEVFLRAVVGAISLTPWHDSLSQSGVTGVQTRHYPAPGLLGSYLPPGGSSLTVKVQVKIAASTLFYTDMQNMKLVVIEAGDG